MATVFALEFTASAWVALFAVLLLKERMTRGHLIAVMLGFLGILIIVRPGFGTLQSARLLMLCVAVSFAIVTIMTKRLTVTKTTFSIIFYMNFTQFLLNPVRIRRPFWQALEIHQAWPLTGLALGGLLAHHCLTNAYWLADASMVLPLDFMRIPLIAFVGWWLYGEALDPFVFIGSACVIVGLHYNLGQEAKPS